MALINTDDKIPASFKLYRCFLLLAVDKLQDFLIILAFERG